MPCHVFHFTCAFLLISLLLLAGNEGPPHLSSTYTTAEKVPHPMVNPTEVS